MTTDVGAASLAVIDRDTEPPAAASISATRAAPSPRSFASVEARLTTEIDGIFSSQIGWYEKQIPTVRILALGSTATVIVAGAIVTLIGIVAPSATNAASILGLVVSVVTLLAVAFKWQAKWAAYTDTMLGLKQLRSDWVGDLAKAQEAQDVAVLISTYDLTAGKAWGLVRKESRETVTAGAESLQASDATTDTRATGK